MTQALARTLIYSTSLLFSLIITSIPAFAQITPDGTTNTSVSPDGNNFTINDGDRAGDNLFHSFQDFSVPTNGSAFFDNASPAFLTKSAIAVSKSFV